MIEVPAVLGVISLIGFRNAWDNELYVEADGWFVTTLICIFGVIQLA